MKESLNESGECTDDSESIPEIKETDFLRNFKNMKNTKKKHSKRNQNKKYKEFRQKKYFNPYLFQKTFNLQIFNQMDIKSDSLINICDCNKVYNNLKEDKKAFQDDDQFSVYYLNVKKYEYCSFIKNIKNRCFSPDKENPIKFKMFKKGNIKYNSKIMETHFEFDEKSPFNFLFETQHLTLSGFLDKSQVFETLLINIGIHEDVVTSLAKIILPPHKRVMSCFSRSKKKHTSCHITEEYRKDVVIPGSDIEVSDDDYNMDGIEMIIDIKYDKPKDLSELKRMNSLYMQDYSPEHMDYNEFQN